MILRPNSVADTGRMENRISGRDVRGVGKRVTAASATRSHQPGRQQHAVVGEPNGWPAAVEARTTASVTAVAPVMPADGQRNTDPLARGQAHVPRLPPATR